MTESLANEVEATADLLQQFLNGPEIPAVARRAGEVGLTQESALVALEAIVKFRTLPPRLDSLWSSLGEAQSLLGRWILALAALRSLSRIREVPVVEEVRQLILRNYRTIADLGRRRDEFLLPRSPEFCEAAETTLLRRFIAGQLHWKVSGIPRSWPFRMNWSDAFRTVGAVCRMGARAPCFEAHLPVRGAPFLIESEYKRCYVRMARSMELQPAIRGILGASWLHSEETMRISPHLQWINQLFLNHGGLLVHMGPAAPESGFLVGSQQRRQLYESGAYRPRQAMFIWPRDAFLQWARQQ